MTGLPIMLIIAKRCGCAVRGLPIRVLPEAVAFLRETSPPADLPMISYRCHKCGETVTLTAGDLHFAA